MPLKFDEYQNQAHNFAVYPPDFHVIYPVLGVAAEAGELAGKVKKHLRNGVAPKDFPLLPPEHIEAIAKEIGDVLWYLAETCTAFGMSLEAVAAMNLHKLTARKANGTIKGEGDDR